MWTLDCIILDLDYFFLHFGISLVLKQVIYPSYLYPLFLSLHKLQDLASFVSDYDFMVALKFQNHTMVQIFA